MTRARPTSCKVALQTLAALLASALLAIAGCQDSGRLESVGIGAASGSVAGSLRSTADEQAQAAIGSRTLTTAHPAFDQGRRRVGSAVLPGEELWVIVQPDASTPAPPADDIPGTGMLVVEEGDRKIPVPLEHTDVKARIDGFVSAVDVTQRFHNPYDTTIEAVYVFPLPDDAAVNGFLMHIGERTIRGVIRKRAEAEEIYNTARAQGFAASLLTQQRPNIFTQKVANLDPGKRIDVEITYFHTLAYVDGWFEYVFPMVVGPRYNPPTSADAGTGIGALPRGQSHGSPHTTNVEYLTPNERSGHDIAIDLTINAGVEIEEIRSASHRIEVTQVDRSMRRVRLAADDTLPNKDFVVRYRVAGDTLKTGLVLQPAPNGRGGHFAMMLIPPATETQIERTPIEFVFVLDCSGSMRGKPLSLAKEAVETALDRVQPGDTFQIIRFSSNASALGEQPLPATQANIQRGRAYLRSLNSGGGTEMIEGIRAALAFEGDPDRRRYVTFLTDGYIGNESEIIAELHRGLDQSRVFSFGVGSSTNRFLMNEMARVGRGASAYIGLNDGADDAMNHFFDRVSRPVLADTQIDWGEFAADDVFPRQLPDLFVGRALLVTGRYTGNPAGSVRVSGRVSGETRTFTLGSADVSTSRDGALAAVWARTQIASIATQARTGVLAEHDASARIEHIALDNGLVSAVTSFVAVDSLTKTDSTTGTTVNVPVPVPDGVQYDTSVGG